MDQDTRNKLQRATQQVRQILEEEFTEQLEGAFDVLPDGNILPEPGKHLDARQRLTRRKLVEAIEHIKASGKTAKQAVDEFTREAAFTFLNRFVALRMLEARGFLQECVSKGDDSSGFKEFCGLAPGLSGLEDGGYRIYLESLFDELTVEVKVLFDRRDSASLLWPRRAALTEVLDILRETELAGIWSEDETIGWVYQYFNSGEERKKMREESQAPRNSRELAVRNQFFTPRYVVEFLTDNTLGRIWYEMRRGQTRLVDVCPYLVRRPNEVFLVDGQQAHEDGSDSELESTQEELLNKTVYIPYRAKKDPRDLKILDPACGSGHFLLYAFDLLISIYDEAWYDEASPKSEITGRRLRDDYSDLEQLHAALPGLVLGHNLHGIDIDPRAAQIAALALWMRGQRTYKDANVRTGARQLIARSNIVCAEAMPGEVELLNEFIEAHLSSDAESRFLGVLVRKVFEAMKLVSDAGSLLKIEDDISEEVAKAKKQWLERPEFKQQTLFDDEPHFVQKELDLTRGITDESFWEEAEQRIYGALSEYAERAEGIGYQRRLFTEDVATGFSFIDLCRTRYDVILMNPPFGEPAETSQTYLRQEYEKDRNEIMACFLSRTTEMLRDGGRLGAISSRTVLFNTYCGDARRRCMLGECQTTELIDLGWRVLDGAAVEAAAYCIQARHAVGQAIAIRALRDLDKEAVIRQRIINLRDININAEETFVVNIDLLSRLPHHPFAYWMSPSFLRACTAEKTFAESGIHALVGLSSADNFRYLRLHWEIPADASTFVGEGSKWVPMAKGGEYNPLYDDIHLMLNWHDNGRELLQSSAATVRNVRHYGKPGGTYPYRTGSGFCVRILPSGCAFSDGGHGLLPDSFAENASEALLRLIAYCHTRIARATLEIFLGEGGSTSAEGAARNYVPRAIEQLPSPPHGGEFDVSVAVSWLEFMRSPFLRDETSREFVGIPDYIRIHGIRETAARISRIEDGLSVTLLEQVEKEDARIAAAFGLSDHDIAFLDHEFGPHITTNEVGDPSREDICRLYRLSKDELTRAAMDAVGATRFTAKKMYMVSRRIELICRTLNITPRQVLSVLESENPINHLDLTDLAFQVLSFTFGLAMGRWGSSFSSFDNIRCDAKDSFAPLPIIPPAANARNQSVAGIFVDDQGHEDDVARAISLQFGHIAPDRSDAIVREVIDILGGREAELRPWLAKQFFSLHITHYSKSRRKAPIYWQVATPSAFYSVWLYYHHFTKDTFFKVLNEYAKPKVVHERQKLERLRGEAGAEPSRSQRKEIEGQEQIVAELASMAEEIERIAPLWNPNLNDGVIINFAPLWRLVPQNKPWQKECKACWGKLVKGEYDWAHLAMHLWPERVVPKCVTDACLAIAHGLEEVFWEQDDRERLQPKHEPEGGWQTVIERLVKERTSPAVKAALQSLLDAPVPSNGSSRSRRRRGSS
ncbi:BREX-1 system adenine-specific DNA-methyltransferase PglX [Crateriforma conspicua]|uniref:BREX-1 system adenine-specific DNA-methyltransferase PglX n=1 Tax=Crateriforma conspicua TaxID=2527996 RepID=UPI00118AE3E2|nr:BREX-1 system adenine-specific DNA-methyltransferase PglX [Crateriforma conspicua]QDV62034.1 N-6 DNA Methylase [Crateriforma conspicua]